MRNLALFAAAAVAVSSLAAQTTTPHERALPKSATGAWGNSAGTYNPVRDGVRMHQTWFRGDNLPNPYIILSIGERLDQNVAQNAAMTIRLKIVLDNSTVTWATMSSTPKNNLSSNATTVFDANINFKAQPGGTNPNQVHAWVTLKQPWVFKGPHLMLEKTWTPAANSTGLRRHDVTSNNAASGIRNLLAGKTCGGDLAGGYTSPNYTVTLTNAPTNALCWFLFSGENVRLGTTRLPLSLTAVGLTGCELGIDPLITVPNKTDSTGMAVLSVPYTVPTTNTAFWSVQAAHTSTKNRAGIATTNVVNTISGKTGLMRQMRVDNRGTKGPDAFNATGPMVLIRGA